MLTLRRKRPDPIPTPQPVPEYLADETLKRRYEEMKDTLQVPWMGVVTMAYAHYRDFYDALWQGLKPLCASKPFVEATIGLRGFVEREVARFRPPPIRARLLEEGYAPRELQGIAEMVEVFSHGNFPYLLIATITRLLLEGEDLPGKEDSVPRHVGRHAPDVTVPFVLMESHHADTPTREVYEDIKHTLGLPFVNTDYRALGRWPSYFALAWSDLKPHVTSPEYAILTEQVHEQALQFAARLPNPGGLSATAICQAAGRDAPLHEVLSVAQLFQWLLPGLVTNIAFFRNQLRDS